VVNVVNVRRGRPWAQSGALVRVNVVVGSPSGVTIMSVNVRKVFQQGQEPRRRENG